MGKEEGERRRAAMTGLARSSGRASAKAERKAGWATDEGSTRPRPEEEAGKESWREVAREASGDEMAGRGMERWVERAERAAARRRGAMERVASGEWPRRWWLWIGGAEVE